jgi:hypothetical protein
MYLTNEKIINIAELRFERKALEAIIFLTEDNRYNKKDIIKTLKKSVEAIKYIEKNAKKP